MSCPKCGREMCVLGIEPESPTRDLYTVEVTSAVLSKLEVCASSRSVMADLD